VILDEDRVRRRAERLAGALFARGLRPGDRVAAALGNTDEHVALREAAAALELTFVPLNPKLTAREADDLVARAGALRVEPAELDGPPQPLREGAIGATILFTSGTTGWPKACVRPEACERARAAELIATYGLDRKDVHLVACPLAHSAPGIFLRAARSVGARTALLPRFDAAAFLDAAGAVGATFAFLVPTQLGRLLALGRPAPAPLRALIVAGAPFPPAVKLRALEWLGPHRLWEFYGSTETGTIAVAPPSTQPGPPGWVGKPPPGVDVALEADGGVKVRSAACMQGYLGEPEVPPGGFVAVGDIARRAGDGLVLIDRKSDVVISGGVNVYPAEVERAIAEHPGVRGAVVCGRPHPDWGEEVCALVVGDVSEAELREFLRERLAAYKIPKQIRLIAEAELPVGATGKPLRRVARERWR